VPARTSRRPARRPLTGISFVIVVGVAAIILVSGALIGLRLHRQESASHAVVYKVTSSTSGTSAKQVSYLTTRGNRHAEEVSLPWTYSAKVQAYKSGAPATLKATQKAGDTGSISCEIDVDGVSMSTNSANGPNAVATCSTPLK
jgi:hypothetical protein